MAILFSLDQDKWYELSSSGFWAENGTLPSSPALRFQWLLMKGTTNQTYECLWQMHKIKVSSEPDDH